MPEKHLSSQFDSELNSASARVMELGGLVESQLRQAIYALTQFSTEAADQVIETEQRVNAMEVEIDRELSSIIGRRQPTARDLRLLIAISKTTANLERVGDEANKIARMVKSIIDSGTSRGLPSSDLRVAADMASGLLRKALDAFARLDTVAAVAILKEDDQIDKEFDGFVRKLITYMMEDPRAWICCSWPRPSSVLATMPRTLQNSSSTSSKARMCATRRWKRSNLPSCKAPSPQ